MVDSTRVPGYKILSLAGKTKKSKPHGAWGMVLESGKKLTVSASATTDYCNLD
jgi:hypothetical protein